MSLVPRFSVTGRRAGGPVPAHVVGFGSADLPGHRIGAPLLGWADPRNLVDGVAEALGARALWIEADGRAVVLVVLELCWVSDRLRRAILARIADLGLDPAAVALLATHNHSGPGGYDDHTWFTLGTNGPAPEVLEDLARGCEAAIRLARADRAPARLELCAAEVLGDVVHNRALDAWRRNPEARTTAAVGRVMRGLVVRAPDGRPRGVFSLFGLHGTTIRGDHRLVRQDHKGRAAQLLEAELPGFVALMAQGAAGDQTPNGARRDPDGRTAGPGRDDLESREIVAGAEADAVLRMLATPGTPIEGGVDAVLRPLRMEGAPAAPEHTGGVGGCFGAAPSLGVAMAEGTDEGHGPLHGVPGVGRVLQRAVRARGRLARAAARIGGRADEPLRRRTEDARFPLLELGAGAPRRLFGVLPIRWLPPVMPAQRWYAEQPAAIDAPAWAPEVLPMQLIRLGQVTLAALPFEPTLVTGARVAAALGRVTRGEVLVAGYANGYGGYAVTPEEYQAHRYEGASTLYGRWTVPVVVTALSELASALAPAVDAPAMRIAS